MVKRTKIKSKDDVTWIKPETIKVKKIAAKCAQKKGKTSNLIKLHEEKIMNEAKSELDEMKRIKVKIAPDKPKHHRDTTGRFAGELFASEVYDMLYSLSAQKTLPKIVISSLLLPMVPLATLTTKDEVSIGSRLENLENGLKLTLLPRQHLAVSGNNLL